MRTILEWLGTDGRYQLVREGSDHRIERIQPVATPEMASESPVAGATGEPAVGQPEKLNAVHTSTGTPSCASLEPDPALQRAGGQGSAEKTASGRVKRERKVPIQGTLAAGVGTVEPDWLKRFLLAGFAEFRLNVASHQTSFHFKLTKCTNKRSAVAKEPPWFASVRDASAKFGFAFVGSLWRVKRPSKDAFVFNASRKAKLNPGDFTYDLIDNFLTSVCSGDAMQSNNVTLEHVGKCGSCREPISEGNTTGLCVRCRVGTGS